MVSKGKSKATASKKTVAKKAAPKAAAKAAAPPAPVAEVKPETVVENVPEKTGPEFTEKFGALLGRIQEVSSLLGALKREFKQLESSVNREYKALAKASGKRKRKTGNRAPSGFVKPTRISDELAGFLGVAKGTELARTEVTREINSYIREHKLQDASNGRKINPDKKLQSLLKVQKGEELTYFNLQRYMSPHFPKAQASA